MKSGMLWDGMGWGGMGRDWTGWHGIICWWREGQAVQAGGVRRWGVVVSVSRGWRWIRGMREEGC